MADYEQLIKKLRTEALDSRKAVLSIYDLCIDAADKIENLISENAALRRQIDNLTSANAVMVKEFTAKLEELEHARGERDVVTKRMIELESSYGQVRKALHDKGFSSLDELFEEYDQVKAALAGKGGNG